MMNVLAGSGPRLLTTGDNGAELARRQMQLLLQPQLQLNRARHRMHPVAGQSRALAWQLAIVGCVVVLLLAVVAAVAPTATPAPLLLASPRAPASELQERGLAPTPSERCIRRAPDEETAAAAATVALVKSNRLERKHRARCRRRRDQEQTQYAREGARTRRRQVVATAAGDVLLASARVGELGEREKENENEKGERASGNLSSPARVSLKWTPATAAALVGASDLATGSGRQMAGRAAPDSISISSGSRSGSSSSAGSRSSISSRVEAPAAASSVGNRKRARTSESEQQQQPQVVGRAWLPALSAGAEHELVELLAELYALSRVASARSRPAAAADASGESTGSAITKSSQSAGGATSISGKMSADEETLNKWLRQRQEKFQALKNFSVELVAEHPNRSINVCADGPKILVLPNITEWLYCYTSDQWLDKLWADLRLAPYHYPIIALNILIFLFGTTGNIFVCLSVYRNHQLRSVTNYFIVNLAFADFLVILICLPATGVWDLTLTWFFGTIPCKLIMFLQDVSISVSVLTLTAISLDRYYAICHPLKFKSNLNQAKRTIVMIWLISLVIMSPDLIYLSAHRSEELSEAGLDTVLYSDCNYNWSERSSRIFQFVKTILLYLVPCLLMIVAHYTIMRTLRAASSICHDELRLVDQHHGTCLGATTQQLVIGCDRNGSLAAVDATPSQAGRQRRAASETFEFRSAAIARGRPGKKRKSPEPGGRALTRAGSSVLAGRRKSSSAVTGAATGEGAADVVAEATTTSGQRKIRFDEDTDTRHRRADSVDHATVSNRAPQVATTRLSTESAVSATNQSGDSLVTDYDEDDDESSWPVVAASATRAGSLCAPFGSGTKINITLHNRSRSESREKAAKMLIAIVVIFAICYLPVHLINFLRQFIEDIPQNDVTSTISMLAHCVCYLNSAINPIIYNHMNSVFRAEFKRFLSCFCWRRPAPAFQTPSASINSNNQQQISSNKQPNNNNISKSINPVSCNNNNIGGKHSNEAAAGVQPNAGCSTANRGATMQHTNDLESSCLTTVIEFGV